MSIDIPVVGGAGVLVVVAALSIMAVAVIARFINAIRGWLWWL